MNKNDLLKIVVDWLRGKRDYNSSYYRVEIVQKLCQLCKIHYLSIYGVKSFSRLL